MKANRGRINRPRPANRGKRTETVEGVVEDLADNAITVDGTEYRVMSARSCNGRRNCVCADHLEWPETGDSVRLTYAESSQGLLFVEGVEMLDDAEDDAPEDRAPAPRAAVEEPDRRRGLDPAVELHRLRGTALTAAARLAKDDDDLEDVVAAAGRLLSWIQSGVLPPSPDVAPIPAATPVVSPAPNGHRIESHRGTVERVSTQGFVCKGAPRWWNYAAGYQGMRVAEGDRIAFDVEDDRVTAVREYTG